MLQLESDGAGNDLSGSEITADRPIVVFAGNVCGGFQDNRTLACDHIEEQMFPTTTWGQSFVVLDMRIPRVAVSPEVWSLIVASEDGTELRFDSAVPLAGLPAEVVTLNKGEVFQVTIAERVKEHGSMSKEPPHAHYRLESSKPVGVVSYMGYEEGGAWVTPVDQFLDEYLVSAHPWFSAFLMVTRPAGTPVVVDGVPLADEAFIPGGGGFEVSFVEMPRCDTTPSKCGHTVEGANIGVTMTANGGVCNYCYAGGAGARCVNKTAGCR